MQPNCFHENLKTYLWLKYPSYHQWTLAAEEVFRCSKERAWHLISGGAPMDHELQILSALTQFSPDQLMFTPPDALFQLDVYRENVSFLLHTAAERHNNRQLANHLGVHEVTVSRWYHQKSQPNPSQVKKLRQLLNVPESIDLRSTALYLNPHTIALHQKYVLKSLIDEYPENELPTIFTALEKLLTRK